MILNRTYGWRFVSAMTTCLALAVPVVDAQTIRLSWDRNSDQQHVTNYTVYFGTRSRVYDFRKSVGLETRTVISGLQEGERYYFAITATNEEGESVYSPEISKTVGGNEAPYISLIANQVVVDSTEPSAIEFSASDDETPAEELVLTATSSNPQVIRSDDLAITSGGEDRTLLVLTRPGQTGRTIVTITARDAQGAGQSRSFSLTVHGQNLLGISPVADQRMPSGSSIALNFNLVVVRDADNLEVQATSTNPQLIPATGLEVTGLGTNRSLTLRPIPSQSGTAQIELRATEGAHSVTRQFQLTVTPSTQTNLPPIVVDFDPEVSVFDQPVEVTFSVEDPDSAPEDVALTARSLNLNVLPEANLELSHVGLEWVLRVSPSPGKYGSAPVEFTITDGVNTLKLELLVNIIEPLPNQAPFISTPPDAFVEVNEASAPIRFSVSDLESPAEAITVRASSSNSALIPASGLVLSGTGVSRTLTIRPALDAVGTATIELSATDPTEANSTTRFRVTVRRTSLTPIISEVANIVLDENGFAGPIAVTISDSDTPLADLEVHARSDNELLLPPANIVVEGAQTNRSLYLRPVANNNGVAQVTLVVSDPSGASAETGFQVLVRASPKSDFNGDGTADLLLQRADGSIDLWFLNRLALSSTIPLQAAGSGDPAWRIVATPDLNDDLKPDVLFQHEDGTLRAWIMDAWRVKQNVLFDSPGRGDSDWRVAGVADFDGDQKRDFLFQHLDGTLAVSLMDGTNHLDTALLTPSNPGSPAWRVVGTGRFDDSGTADILFQHANGTLAVWCMTHLERGAHFLLEPSSAGDLRLRAIIAEDYNRDGKTDILFQRTDGALSFWLMDGRRRLLEAPFRFPVSVGWEVAPTR